MLKKISYSMVSAKMLSLMRCLRSGMQAKGQLGAV
jgi:hypothetical protein